MDKSKTCFNGCIYKYTNLLNDKIYIGQTSNINQRRAYHENSNNVVYPIDKALSKYGLTNFKFEILTEITADSYDAYKHSIDELERFYINKYRNDGFVLYNITDGGGYSWLDYNATREYKPLSDLQKEKISKSLRKYYKTHKRKKFFGGKNPNAKRIVGIKDGIVVCKYECGKDLCTLLDMNYSTFKKRVQNKTLIVNNVLYIYETDIKKNI